MIQWWDSDEEVDIPFLLWGAGWMMFINQTPSSLYYKNFHTILCITRHDVSHISEWFVSRTSVSKRQFGLTLNPLLLSVLRSVYPNLVFYGLKRKVHLYSTVMSYKWTFFLNSSSSSLSVMKLVNPLSSLVSILFLTKKFFII